MATALSSMPRARGWWWLALGLVRPLAGVLVLAMGAVVWVGWWVDSESMKRIEPEWVAVNPATAAAFVFGGFGLILMGVRRWGGARTAGRVLGFVMAGIGAIKLVAWMHGPDLRVDQIFFTSKLSSTTHVMGGVVFENRMAPNAALLLLMTGLAVAALRSLKRWLEWCSLLLPLGGILVATLALIGYFNGVTSLYKPTASLPIAFTTVIGILVLCGGILGSVLQEMMEREEAGGRGIHPGKLDGKITIGFGTALFLLAIIGVVSYASIRDFTTVDRMSKHSEEVIAAMSEVGMGSTDSENAMRGFVVTGEESALEGYGAARAAMPARIEAVENLVEDNREQEELAKQLEGLVDAHEEVMESTIAARRQGSWSDAEKLAAMSRSAAAMAEIRKVLRTMRTAENALQAYRSAQTERTGRLTTWVISIGGILAFVLVGLSGWFIRRDLAERRRLDAELRRARAAADAANAAKSSFLANMSHEIRTPMSSIIGYADLILDPHQTQSDRLDYVNTIRRNGDHLMTIVNDVLDLSKIEAGKFQVHRTECNPCQVLSDVASLMRVRAAERKIRLDVMNGGLIPATVQTDPSRLRQVLINLVGNAIKFTEQGWVRLIMRMDEKDRMKLRFDVIDTGIGMSAGEMSHLFEPFVQADDSATRRFGGTGLGLTISKRLVEMLGGEIFADSAVGRGSTFSFTIDPGPLEGVRMLPNCKEAVAGGEEEKPAVNGAEKLEGRVLLVDDGVDNRRLLSVYLRQAGAQVTLAENGLIGCEKALASAGIGMPYDVVLMDMQMPELDGYGATSRLRAKGYTGAVVALTAHAMAEDREKCMNAGCTDYLSKPVKREELLGVVAKYIRLAKALAAAEDKAKGPGDRAEPAVSAGVIRSDLEDESLKSFLKAYVGELPIRVVELQACLDQGDMDELAARLHNLKGTGGLYGLMPISTAAGKAAGLIQSRAAVEAIEKQVRELMEIIRRVEGFDAKRTGARG